MFFSSGTPYSKKVVCVKMCIFWIFCCIFWKMSLILRKNGQTTWKNFMESWFILCTEKQIINFQTNCDDIFLEKNFEQLSKFFQKNCIFTFHFSESWHQYSKRVQCGKIKFIPCMYYLIAFSYMEYWLSFLKLACFSNHILKACQKCSLMSKNAQ